MPSTLQFKPVVKDSLFYGRWRYCISFMLEEVSCLKHLDHDYIDTILERRKYWIEISHQRLTKATSQRGTPTIMSKRRREITEVTELNLHQLANTLLGATNEFKLVTSVDQCWVYSNDVELIEELSLDYELKYKTYTEAIVDRPKDTIRLKNPTHAQRSYFKTLKLTPQVKETICNFFKNQSDIRLSPSLAYWINEDLYRTQDYFFVDHTGESWLLMLALVKPGLIRKTVTIIPS